MTIAQRSAARERAVDKPPSRAGVAQPETSSETATRKRSRKAKSRSLLNKWRTPFYGGGTPSAVLPLLAMAVPLLVRTPYIWHSGARSLAYSTYSTGF
ncbi:MAG: hypothetical protein ACI80V_002936 [Rhodothermales bacterium]|jgi:hypothetical protein